VIDPLDPMRAALAKLTPTNRATTYGFAPPTTGHWCATCRTHTRVEAELIKIDGTGAHAIATFGDCPTCCH
jgi:hypothetical protein